MSDWSENLLHAQARIKEASGALALSDVLAGTHREAHLRSAEHGLLEAISSARDALAWVRQQQQTGEQ